MATKYFYHLVDGDDSLVTLKKYGLCSPLALVEEIALDDVIERMVERYGDRARKFKHLDSGDAIAVGDILEFLDAARLPLTASCIFWSFISVVDMPFIKSRFSGTEVRLSLSNLKKMATGNPILVQGKSRKQITWSQLSDGYSEFSARALVGATVDPKLNLKFKHMIHLAVPSKIIPFSKLQVVSNHGISK